MEKSIKDEIGDDVWIEDYQWVGIVYPYDVRENVAFITPLAYYDQNDGWQTITESERSQYFPNNGKVARFVRDFSVQKVNRLYWFWPEYNQQRPLSETLAVTDSRYSRYLTYDDSILASEPLGQVFHWSSKANTFFAVVDLLAQGIPARDCLSQTIFIHYQDQVYGPIRLEPDYSDAQLLKPREYNQRLNPSGQLLLLNGYSFFADQIITLAGQSFLDPKILGSPRHQTDWSLPQTTMKRVLRASNTLSTELQRKERLVEREINDLASLSALNGPEVLRLEECVIRHAQYIVKHQIKRLDGIQELIEGLSEDHALLEKARLIEVQRRKERIAQEYQQEQSQLQTLRQERRHAEEILADLNEKILAADLKQEQMRTELAALEVALPKRLMELREDMLSLFKDLQFTSALSIAPSQTNREEPPLERAQVGVISTDHQQSHFITMDNVTTITDLRDLYWAEVAIQNRTSIKRVRTSAAALLAGLIPAVNDIALLQTVAQAITGQRIWSVPVSLTATEPLALFGHISVDQGLFVPAVGELVDIFIEAQDYPEQLGLIVLEGIDRVPFLPVIEPLLRQYRAVRQHIQQTEKATPCEKTLQLFHPRALVSEDPYQKISRLAWPVNLLLGVTFDEEIGSFSLPGTYASWFAHIQRMETDDRANSRWSGNQKSWQASSTNWYAWEKECAEQAYSQNVLSLPENFEPWQRVFYEAMKHFGMKKDLIGIIEQLWPQE